MDGAHTVAAFVQAGVTGSDGRVVTPCEDWRKTRTEDDERLRPGVNPWVEPLQGRSGEYARRDSNPSEKPLENRRCGESGAESGALVAIDSALASIIDAWPTLPDPIRALVESWQGG